MCRFRLPCLAIGARLAAPAREEATMGAGRRRGRNRDGLDDPLTPVRWRRPGRGLLVRLAAVAALLVTAATVMWARPESNGCTPLPAGGASPIGSAARSTAATPRRGDPPPGYPTSAAAVPQGAVGVPVRLAEPTALALVHPGDRVDLLRVDAAGGDSALVAAGALVLGVTSADDPTTGGLLLALKPIEAAKAVATAGHGFAVIIRPS
jgi:hypothetical protein